MSTELEGLLKSLKGETPRNDKEEMVVHVSKGVQQLTVNLLKKAVAAYPDHPLAAVYTKAVENLPDDHAVNVDVTDLQGLLENREVINETGKTLEGRTTIVKRLGEVYKSKSPAPTPKGKDVPPSNEKTT